MISKINEMVLSLVARLHSEKGQAMAEYGLLLALIAVIVAVSAALLGTAITGTFDDVIAQLP